MEPNIFAVIDENNIVTNTIMILGKDVIADPNQTAVIGGTWDEVNKVFIPPVPPEEGD